MEGQTNTDDINLGELIEKHGSKLGIPIAFLTYGGIRGLSDIVLPDGFIDNGLMPIVAAYISSCVGHQITPNKHIRFFATTVGPAMAGYEFAGYLSNGLEWLLSGMQEYIARPLDHPVDTVENAAKSIYNEANKFLGKPFDEADTSPKRIKQGALEKGLETVKDQLKYVRYAGTLVAAHYLRKLSKPVREQFLRLWEKPETFLERWGRKIGLRKPGEAKLG